jgi:hypothetical protein
LTDLKIGVTSALEVRADGGCFLRITFPAELDFSTVDFKDIEAISLLASENGKTRTSAVENGPNFVLIQGCEYGNTANKNYFEVTLKGAKNPSDRVAAIFGISLLDANK